MPSVFSRGLAVACTPSYVQGRVMPCSAAHTVAGPQVPVIVAKSYFESEQL